MSTIQTMREDGTSHPQEIVNHFLNSVIEDNGGVFDREDDGMKVIPTTPASMDIEISTGSAVITNDSTEMAYPVRLYDGNTTKTVTANASGNPRVDSVVIYIDTSATPNATVTNVAKAEIVEGTAGASPTAPSDSDIVSAIDGSYPYIILAEIDVSAGATSITATEITSTRGKPTMTKKASRINDYQLDYSIASDELTIEIKDGDGQSFSISNIGYFKVDDDLLKVNSQLSLTLEDTANYCPYSDGGCLDGTDLDLFVYIINNNGTAEMGVSLSPVEKTVTAPFVDDSGITTGSNGAKIIISGTRNATNTMKNIGVVGAKQATDYDWETPTNALKIHHPFYSSRETGYSLDIANASSVGGINTATTESGKFKISNGLMFFNMEGAGATASPVDPVTVSARLPVRVEGEPTDCRFACRVKNNGSWVSNFAVAKEGATPAVTLDPAILFSIDADPAHTTSWAKGADYGFEISAVIPIKTRK